MLAAVAEVLERCRALVTFNGRRFDLPLLETRLTLSRLPSVAPGLPHLDLLYPARRLYSRRLPSCRLAALECALLGVEREDDVPGWAIPALYFEYVRRGETRPLRAVFKHNALDILSLVVLTAHLGRLWSTLPPDEPDDCLALARWEESAGRTLEAITLYEAALGTGLDGGLRTYARRRLARLCRRQGRWEDAARLWQEEAGDGGPAGQRLEALVELAKLEEHRRRDYTAAEALTQRALSLLEVLSIRDGASGMCLVQREALEHRLWRLRRRLATARRRLQA
jgi:tetratricopeptide (TPR) repeat protein